MSTIEKAMERLSRERPVEEPEPPVRRPLPFPGASTPFAGESSIAPGNTETPDHANQGDVAARDVEQAGGGESVSAESGPAHTVPVPVKTRAQIAPVRELAPSIVWDRPPTSELREDFRRLQVMLHRLSQSSPCDALLVTSTMHGEGKSTVTANLAVTICSELERRVVLVDCDMWRPQAHHLLGYDRTIGLGDYLADDQVELADVLVETKIPKLDVIFAGRSKQNPAELVGTTRMAALVKLLKESHDMVLLDSPPVLPVSDPVILAKLVDGVIMVIESERTKKQSVNTALSHLQDAPILGFIFNKARRAATPEGYDSYYDYSAYATRNAG